MKKNSSKDPIVIPRKSFIAMLCLVPLVAVILSKRDLGALIVLMLGVASGIFICKGFYDKGKNTKAKKKGQK
jgi:hypothetical protein